MTRDDIIRMAGECLIRPHKEHDDNGTGMWATFTVYKGSIVALEEFAALVAAAEREACAKLCDVVIPGDEYSTALINSYADNIRARGQV